MLSRASRIATLSAQVIGACPLWRDNTQTAPKVVAPSNGPGLAALSSTYCAESFRQRSTSINCGDPFLGTSSAENDVIQELELLDLDKWNTDKQVVVGHRAAVKAPSASVMITHETHEAEKMSPWIEHFVDISAIDHELGLDRNCVAPPTTPDGVTFADELDRVSNQVDWEIWDKYLDDDYDTPMSDLTSSFVKEEPKEYNYVNYLSSVPRLETLLPFQSPLLREVKKEETYMDETFNFVAQEVKKEVEDYTTCPSPSSSPKSPFVSSYDDLNSSGPLTWIPSSEKQPRKMKSSPSREMRKPRRYDDSERSWTPSSDEFGEEKPKYKKRGVVMKPSVDLETDRRRALNRVAALRYREKKRFEQQQRKRDFLDELNRNRRLRQQERHIRAEIAKMRQKITIGVVTPV